MRKAEQVLWDDLKRVMGRDWQADRIETRDTALNVPDVNFLFRGEFTGWIELKQIDAWHRNNTQVTHIPNLTIGQKIWLRDHHAAGANCWLLLWVQRSGDYLFIPGNRVGLIGDLPRRGVEDQSFPYRGLPAAHTIKRILATGKGVQ